MGWVCQGQWLDLLAGVLFGTCPHYHRQARVLAFSNRLLLVPLLQYL